MNDLLTPLRNLLPQSLQLLEQFVNLESPSLDKPLVDRFARFAGSKFEQLGGQVDYVPADRFGDHVRIRFPGDSPHRILLLGHTDTVWPTGESEKRPFRIESGRALGPGVFDMKAGILLMWMAIHALRTTRGGF